MPTIIELAPLSVQAEQELKNVDEYKYSSFSLFFPFFFFFGIPCLLACLLTFPVIMTLIIFAILATTIVATVVPLALPRMRRNWQRERTQLLLENARDYLRSQELDHFLAKFKGRTVDSFANPEPVIPGEWRPYAVEHFLSQSIRGELQGVSSEGLLRGAVFGKVIPNLFDICTILFLQDAQGETLRVLLPSPEATREIYRSTIRGWLGHTSDDSHTRRVITQFPMTEELLIAPVQHPRVIDRLHAACQKPLAERPVVTVRGISIHDGVVLSTEMTVNGKRSTFFPSGFFRELTWNARLFIEGVVEPQTLTSLTRT